MLDSIFDRLDTSYMLRTLVEFFVRAWPGMISSWSKVSTMLCE